MNSENDKVKKIVELVDKTEQNIRQIQNVGEAFVYPVLYEWQYVTRHMANVLGFDAKMREAEMQKAIDHLGRAYYDSCEVLLTVYLHQAIMFFKRYRNIVDLINEREFLSNYMDHFIAGRCLIDRKKWGMLTETSSLPQDMEVVLSDLEKDSRLATEIEPALEYARTHLHRRQLKRLFVIVAFFCVGVLLSFVMMWRHS